MNILSYFKQVTTFVFDVDGVLTDGTLLVLDNGQMVRKMNIKDGYALQLAIKKNYKILIISGGDSEPVKNRLLKLGVTDVYMRVEDKKNLLIEYADRNNLNLNEILFMGDDIPDLSCMKIVGLPCCPGDSAKEIQGISKYISSFNGGYGCARDVIEKVLTLRGDWNMDKDSPAI